MIIGIGCDIVSITRIKKLIVRFQETFLRKIYTREELQAAPNPLSPLYFSYYSKRFAAKEAYAKATKNGIGKNITFQSIAILNDKNGAPYFCTHPLQNSNVRADLSLSDEPPYALSYVILSK
jgi:holo-[acyl-carrier protein] synthase